MFPYTGPNPSRAPHAPRSAALDHNTAMEGDSTSISPVTASNQPSTNVAATANTKQDQTMQAEQSRNRDAKKERKKRANKAAKELKRTEEDEKKRLEDEKLASLMWSIPLIPGVQSRALESARKIDYFGAIKYPEGINAPSAGLNMGQGRYTYNRKFTLQFMPVCRDKPKFASNLEGLGVERPARSDENDPPAPTGSQNLASTVAPRPAQGVVSGHGDFNPIRITPKGANGDRSQRGRPRKQRNEDASLQSNTSQPLQQQHQDGRQAHDAFEAAGAGAELTSWSVGMKARTQDTNSPEFVETKIKALLNKMTSSNFDSISDQIVNLVNNTQREQSRAVLDLVIKLVVEQAAGTALFSRMLARMSGKIKEKWSPKICDSNNKSAAGDQVVDGHLFRNQLRARCTESSKRYWSMDRAGATDPSTQDHKGEGQNGRPIMLPDKYYAICKARREGLNIILLMGELLKLKLVQERVMHRIISQLLAKIDDKKEDEIECLCILLTNIGQKLDMPRGKDRVDAYFAKMRESAEGDKLPPRPRYKLLDVIELRARNWLPRGTVVHSSATGHPHEQGVQEAQGTTREMQADKRTRKSRGKKSTSHGTSGSSVPSTL